MIGSVTTHLALKKKNWEHAPRPSNSIDSLFPQCGLFHNSSKSPFHACTIVGTERFIVWDVRSESTNTSMFSDIQWEWSLVELEAADSYDFVVWVTSRPWIGPAVIGDDAWRGQPDDHALVSEWI